MPRKKPRPYQSEAAQFRAALEAAQLSQMDAARALDVADRTIRAYALGENKPPRHVLLAIAHLAEHGPLRRELIEEAREGRVE